MTTFTDQPAPAPGPRSSGPSSRPGRWISVLVIVLGTIAGVLALGGGVVRGVAAHASTSNDYVADAAGLEQLRIDSTAAAFEVRFADVEQAQLAVSTDGGPAQEWRLEREGSTLVVGTDRRWRWFGFGFSFGGNSGEQLATLTLPAALERSALDLDVDVAAGSFAATGAWGETTVDLSAGDVDLGGTAASVAVEVSAGEARLDLSTDGAVELGVSAGRILGSLTGEQPSSITASASAGSIDLDIPDGAYAVTEQASAGTADVRVVDDPSAASTIDVDVSAGSITLRPAAR
ncbi:DUF4097 family beta strand repeat-containing protein [Agrococcus sp. 1P02AA]|uniref:hypothetical protein n=1 Tax=Agrococcus sp. 1P02AA TaxID=3132259 RepID=UPI0039A70A01